MFAVAEEPARFESGGMYVPDSRKDLMLLMRSREEAEGESRMMGSGRRPGFLSLEARDVVVVVVGATADGFLRSLKNCSECLRIWEKSCVRGNQYLVGVESRQIILTVGLIPRKMLFLSPILLSRL